MGLGLQAGARISARFSKLVLRTPASLRPTQQHRTNIVVCDVTRDPAPRSFAINQEYLESYGYSVGGARCEAVTWAGRQGYSEADRRSLEASSEITKVRAGEHRPAHRDDDGGAGESAVERTMVGGEQRT